ncbi:hypothetical protein [Noviherbaspirillum pedocola]|uniref:Uncharacterized protein n=1 Tax=Noviherbaspirillum pedocola TaxID=2801341 RepID=A0A934T126_9BURK|nr:hypothetical protein [Noviherbaspirillum pedocola]MBK4736634.1 hypothetical protein [Noviherbaspirillum pedocola]
MQKGKTLFQTGAIGAALVCAIAAGNAHAGQSQQFSATINTTEQLVMGNPLCPGQAAGVGAGTGTSNVFAKSPNGAPVPVGMASTDCVQTDGAQPPLTLTFQNGYFILTGPGGDSIMAKYTGYLNLDPANSVVLPVYKFNGSTQFIITGGTGRFARASGVGTISGSETVNFLNGTSQGMLNAVGTINY